MIRLLNISEQYLNLLFSETLEQCLSFEEKRLLIDGYCSHNNTVCFKSNGKSGSLVLKKFCDDMFMDTKFSVTCEGIKVEELIGNLVENYIVSVDRDTKADILRVGISCLYRFVQLNWTGPELTEDEEVDVLKLIHGNLKTKFGEKFVYDINEMKKSIEKQFDNDGISLHANVRNIELLMLAMHIFVFTAAVFPSGYWWLIRCFMLHQQLLGSPISYAYQKLNDIFRKLKILIKNSEDKVLSMLLDMEMIQIHIQIYHNVVSTNEILREVLKSVGIQTSLVGALGKRTRFQGREIPQLALDVNVIETEPMELYLPQFSHGMPKDLILTDEVRLPKIEYSDGNTRSYPSLTEMQRTALLPTLVVLMKCKPYDELLLEELSPYVNCILSQPMHWSVQMSVLLIRSRVESSDRRTIERSLCQLESLLNDINSTKFPPCDRMPFFFCSHLVPKWEIETALARLLLVVGATKSALDIYIKLKQWEDVVHCYSALKMKHKAEEVIRKEMENGETVKLWCALGDATDDVTCYEKAWVLSNEQSSLPMKHWALFLYKRKRYAESIPRFQKSLQKNNLQGDLWYRLGYAALIEEKWEISTTAYKQYCALEPDSFEAWNNMGKAYLQLGRYEFAFLAFQDAVKCNFENWMVWENLMTSSAKVNRLDEVIRCYHRILDLKGKHLDKRILEFIVHSTTNPGSKTYHKTALQLFGRLIQFANDADIWLLYADLVDMNKENTLESLEPVMRYANRAYAIRTRDNDWEMDRTLFSSVVAITLKLADVYHRKSSIKQLPEKERINCLVTSKEIIQRVIKRIEIRYNDNVEWKKDIDMHTKSLQEKMYECTQCSWSIISDDDTKYEIDRK